MGFFQNTCKPEGLGGKVMVAMMNTGHTSMAEWGISYLPDTVDGKVVDIGCGGGMNVNRLLKKYSNSNVYGVDYSEVSVNKAKSVNQSEIDANRCVIQQENVRHLTLVDESFALATAFETIYFWPEIEESFKEVYRILKSGGQFFICNECDGDNQADSKWEKSIEGMKIYKKDEIVSFLKNAGFSDVVVNHDEKKHLINFLAKK